MSRGEVQTEAHARAILGLAADAPPSTWRVAFQREVKAAHPDRGGDPDRVRLVIEAYRFLKLEELKPRASGAPRAQSQPQPTPRPQPVPKPAAEAKPQSPPVNDVEPEPVHAGRYPSVRINVAEAFKGCERELRVKQRRKFKVRLPGGLQTGDVVRFGKDGEHFVTIEVTPHEGAQLRGADLWLTVRVSAEFLKEGGRMEVHTPLGVRRFWVSRTSAARGLFRSPGDGLPARSNRAKGHLYLKFELDPALDRSPARSLLERFAAAWASA
jgi:DnaJ-class molecular chaperone